MRQPGAVDLIRCVLLASVCGQQRSEPLCEQKVCQSGEACRVVKRCPENAVCIVQAECIPSVNSSVLEGGCIIGNPLVEYTVGGSLDLVTCYQQNPCPEKFYCSATLQDVPARCCRSDSVSPPKTGVCPPPTDDRPYCTDRCLSDGDCDYDMKCCGSSCKVCAMPDPCATQTCQAGSECRLSSSRLPECFPVTTMEPVLKLTMPRRPNSGRISKSTPKFVMTDGVQSTTSTTATTAIDT